MNFRETERDGVTGCARNYLNMALPISSPPFAKSLNNLIIC